MAHVCGMYENRWLTHGDRGGKRPVMRMDVYKQDKGGDLIESTPVEPGKWSTMSCSYDHQHSATCYPEAQS